MLHKISFGYTHLLRKSRDEFKEFAAEFKELQLITERLNYQKIC